jgi:nucleoside-diphosphate-sugar epimerase
MLRVISYCARRALPIPQFGRSNAPFNVVPVDFVLDAMLAGAVEPAALGQTFHLVDPEPVTAVELFRILAEAYAGRAPSWRLPPQLVTAGLRAPAVRAMFGGAPPESIRYLTHPVRFDARRASDVLGGAAGLRVPRFEEYAETLVRFFREREDDPAYSVSSVSS